MTVRLATTTLLLVILSPCVLFANNGLFDIIIPEAIGIRTANNTIGQLNGGYGWLIAVGDTLTPADLQGATFTGTVNEPAITSVTPQFLNVANATPISPGQAVGSTFQNNIYSPAVAFWRTVHREPRRSAIWLGFQLAHQPGLHRQFIRIRGIANY